jgi:hypothetical protein
MTESGSATAGLLRSVSQGTDARRGSHHTLRAEIAHLYAAAYGKTCRQDTLDALEAIVAWLRRVERNDGRTFLRSIPEAARGVEGWQTSGHSREDRNRFRNSLVRRLEMLAEMGVVESYESLWTSSGLARGILVTLRRDSSVGGARSTRHLARRLQPPVAPSPDRELSTLAPPAAVA